MPLGFRGATTPPGPSAAGALFWKLVWKALAPTPTVPGFWSQVVDGGRRWSGSFCVFGLGCVPGGPAGATSTPTFCAMVLATLLRPFLRSFRSSGLLLLEPGGL